MYPSVLVDMISAMSTFASARAAGRIEGLEALLSRLRRCSSPAQAENLVAYAIPDLVDAIWATLYLSDDGAAPVVYGDDTWQHLADAALARRMPCATRANGEVTTAIPIFADTGVAGVLADGERRRALRAGPAHAPALRRTRRARGQAARAPRLGLTGRSHRICSKYSPARRPVRRFTCRTSRRAIE